MTDQPPRLAVALNGYGLEHDEPDGTWREVLGWEDLAGLGRLAEDLGYEAIFAPEIGGWESFTMLTGMATQTDRIGLASGVIPLSARGPETLAMGAASLQELSRGRFTLGVGSRAPIEQTRARLRTLHGLLRSGEGHDGDRHSETDWLRDPRPVPLFLAALGPRMTALAGEVADGVILNWCTPERVRDARAAISNPNCTIAVYVRACLSPVDDDAYRALRVAASRYAGMGPYRRQFESMGVDPSNLGEVVAAVCVQGSADTARGRFAEYVDAGADVVVVYPVAAGEAVSSLTGTLTAAAPGG